MVDANDYSIIVANSASGFERTSGPQFCYAATHQREEPCSSAEHPCPLEIVRETGSAATVEHVHSDGEGNKSIFEIHGYPIADRNGVVTRMAEYCLDITERKQSEEKREHLVSQLQSAISEIKTLEGLLPICSYCKKVRDDKGYWSQIENYIRQHSQAEFTHSICPECTRKIYPNLYDDIFGNSGK